MISCIVMPVSRLNDIAGKTACTQMKVDIDRYILCTSSPLCGIREPRYGQNNKGYQILRIGYQSIFDYHDSLIACIVMPKSRLHDVAQKTTWTQNLAMDVTFHLRYVQAFNNVHILRNPWKNSKILFMCFLGSMLPQYMALCVSFRLFRLFRFVKKNVCLNDHADNCLIHFYSKLIWKTTYDGRRLKMEDDLWWKTT